MLVKGASPGLAAPINAICKYFTLMLITYSPIMAIFSHQLNGIGKVLLYCTVQHMHIKFIRIQLHSIHAFIGGGSGNNVS